MSQFSPSFDLSITRDDLRFIAQVVHSHAGIVIREHKEAMARGRLARRVKALGLTSVAEYCALLRRPEGASEIGELINAVTTNHTSFFRERHHFDHLRQAVLPSLMEITHRPAGRVRLWCSASSSGEEPYSIAACVHDAFKGPPKGDFRILATDIDSDILRRAEAGRYASEAVERMPADLRPLLKLEATQTPGEYRVPDAIRRLVTFKRLNLIEPWPVSGPFDVIFCRNVLIYFDQPTTSDIIDRFVEVLRPGGWLYLGHSESRPHLHPSLEVIGRTIYRRK
ncbi:protein-glutamate O-methyltransferase [Chelatococcus sp. SYSU_G07232]|uniref:Chemotaxis protein methyltransferase n=1 Tax=Chelatococcus albus TaxID=3047466 RepID=A0ABT7AFA8_9HYPH|nr:protein-glutamate O-methyltransferase [Chelatococcus sp. SYSU_G07232]MDJ1158045.1 protein-glutamate O-methyltransferase [Chelatococcus sp. SYSU_G07232]